MQYHGHYRGEVYITGGNRGRCKIYVPSIYPTELNGISSDNKTAYGNLLPWAEPAMPIFGGNTNGQGMCSWPQKGAIVWVFFDEGDLNQPVYFAGSQGGEAWVSQNKDQYVIQTKNTKLTIDDEAKTVTLIVASGVNIKTPKTTIDGELYVTGDIKSDGEVEDYHATMTADRIIFDTHIHLDSNNDTISPPTTKQSGI